MHGVTVLIQRPNYMDDWKIVSEWNLGNETPVAQTVAPGTHNTRVKSSTSQGMQKLIKPGWFFKKNKSASQTQKSQCCWNAAHPVKFSYQTYCNSCIIKKQLIKTMMTQSQHQCGGNCSCMCLHWGSCISGFQIRTKCTFNWVPLFSLLSCHTPCHFPHHFSVRSTLHIWPFTFRFYINIVHLSWYVKSANGSKWQNTKVIVVLAGMKSKK